VNAGATWYFSEVFGVGANAAYLFAPAVPASRVLLGLEGSFRFAPGLALSAGYNLEAFGVGDVAYLTTRPGLYLRLDWKFDERTFGLGQ
jgi:hypothetical protein